MRAKSPDLSSIEDVSLAWDQTRGKKLPKQARIEFSRDWFAKYVQQNNKYDDFSLLNLHNFRKRAQFLPCSPSLDVKLLWSSSVIQSQYADVKSKPKTCHCPYTHCTVEHKLNTIKVLFTSTNSQPSSWAFPCHNVKPMLSVSQLPSLRFLLLNVNFSLTGLGRE